MTMAMKLLIVICAAATAPAQAASARQSAVDPAVFTDPVHNPTAPARMEVLHIPSGGVAINGLAYVAAGPGAHPVVVLCHGLPGNEKNLDLAQAVRRAGWTVITFNYRGSWGSPGRYRFAQNLEDAKAVLAYLRDPANAKALGLDTGRMVIIGHSMGGWVAAMTGEQDAGLRGVGLISAANLGMIGHLPRADAVTRMRDNGVEALAETSPEIMADELIANAAAFDWGSAAAKLAGRPLLVATSDDGLAPMADALAGAVKAAGGTHIQRFHAATDHGWSDARISLESEVIRWLRTVN